MVELEGQKITAAGAGTKRRTDGLWPLLRQAMNQLLQNGNEPIIAIRYISI
jgi:hypothetical protein